MHFAPSRFGWGLCLSWYGLCRAGDRGAAPAALRAAEADFVRLPASGGLRPFRFPSYPTIRSAKARPSLAAASAIMLY